MNTYFTAHGYRFVAEGSGFRTAAAAADFETIVSNIEDVLRALPAEQVASIHAGATISDETGEPVDDKAASHLWEATNRCAVAVLRSWHNPDAALVWASAA